MSWRGQTCTADYPWSVPSGMLSVNLPLGMVATTRYELRGLCACAVGDRQVLDRMHVDGFNQGGERSGHIIMTDHATTGDGLMAALPALSTLIKSQKPASETFHVFEPVPHLLRNWRE